MSITTDVLIEQVQELERERDELREQVARLEAEQKETSALTVWLGQENYRLRGALEKYGRHRIGCCWNAGRCDCGLDEALKGEEPA